MHLSVVGRGRPRGVARVRRASAACNAVRRECQKLIAIRLAESDTPRHGRAGGDRLHTY